MLNRVYFLCVGVLLLCSACSGTRNALPARGPYGIAVRNHFAEARGMLLSKEQVDSYIAASVTGADRKLAETLMAAMPPNLRGDFISVDDSGHVVSNNRNLLQYAVVKYVPLHAATSAIRVRAANAWRVRPMDGYQSQCAPPASKRGRIFVMSRRVA